MPPKVYPVIHHRDIKLTLEQAKLAHACGADGVFVISHGAEDYQVIRAADLLLIERESPDFKIGINLLTLGPLAAMRNAISSGFDMIWDDHPGVTSKGVTSVALLLQAMQRQATNIQIFASVAFKYQAFEPQPALAAVIAKSTGFIATTSGTGTGRAPSLAKIQAMSEAVAGELAVASGITPNNAEQFKGLVSHILVATGISIDAFHFDREKLERLIQEVRKE